MKEWENDKIHLVLKLNLHNENVLYFSRWSLFQLTKLEFMHDNCIALHLTRSNIYTSSVVLLRILTLLLQSWCNQDLSKRKRERERVMTFITCIIIRSHLHFVLTPVIVRRMHFNATAKSLSCLVRLWMISWKERRMEVTDGGWSEKFPLFLPLASTKCPSSYLLFPSFFSSNNYISIYSWCLFIKHIVSLSRSLSECRRYSLLLHYRLECDCNKRGRSCCRQWWWKKIACSATNAVDCHSSSVITCRSCWR